ncbi:MAG TPA: HEAT repeat domain-containing protein [Planctomycetota bacterium]|nr:HEAT repeat domain-containing protein [Planctomycetota bacterium]
MLRNRCIALFVAAGLLVFIHAPLSGQGAAPPREDEQKLIAVLKSDAPIFEKAKACQRLAVVGSKEAVPALAKLLEDEKIAHYARFALEPIPDPSVDTALRAALAKLEGNLLVGVINSIGTRRDAGALEALTGLVGKSKPEIQGAAVGAVGRIGTPEAASVLTQHLSAAAEPLRPVVAEATLACAEQLLATGKSEAALALYETVRKARLPEHIQAAAMRGAIVGRKAAGLPLLVEGLQATDPTSFEVALGAIYEIPGSETTLALVAQLEKLPPERQVQVLKALAARGDAAALPAVLESARGSPASVRAAAIGALRSLGDASAVPVLLDAAAASGGKEAEELAATAHSTLEEIGGKGVDEAIAGMLEKGDKRLRPLVIELVGRRGIASAVPALKKAAGDPDESIRLAAIQALGMASKVEDLPVLISRLVSPGTPLREAAAAQEALKAAGRRLSDKDGCAEKLLEPMAAAPVEAKVRLLEVFSSVGGRKALQAAAASARDSNEDLKTAAIKVLGDWMSEEAAPELLGLLKSSSSAKDRGRALESFRRVVSGLRFPKEQRLDLCKEAMSLGKNDEERKVVLRTLAAIPAVETIPHLTPYLANPALKDEAGSALVTIGERILRYQPDVVRDAMKQVIESGGNKDLAERAKKVFVQAGGKL